MSEAKRFQDWLEDGGVSEGDVFICVGNSWAKDIYTKGKEYVVINNPAYRTLSLTDNWHEGDKVSSCEATASTFIKKQKEEKKMAFDGKQLFGKKYRVTPETSKLIQEAVFAAGGCWYCGEKEVLELESKFLWVDSEGLMAKSDFDEELFIMDKDPEGIITIGITGVSVVDKEKEEKKKQLEELDAKIKELQAIANKLKEGV